MVTPEQLPSDLTLELQGELSPERFIAAARAFFGCVQEVSRAVAAEGDGPGWIVRTREGSHLLGLDPAPDAKAALVKAVYARLNLGIAELVTGHSLVLETGNATPLIKQWLPLDAISHLKTLSELSDRPQRNPVAVKIWIERKPTVISHQVAKTISESLGEAYRDFGTIEGRLDAVLDRNTLQIRVHDPVMRQTVVCHIGEDMLLQAFAYFRKRVEISGVIHYRRNATPASIDVENIEVLPDDSDLPSLAEVRGILRLEE